MDLRGISRIKLNFLLDIFVKIHYIYSAIIINTHAACFHHIQLLRRWGYIIFYYGVAIMSQISHNLIIFKRLKFLDQIFDRKNINFTIQSKHNNLRSEKFYAPVSNDLSSFILKSLRANIGNDANNSIASQINLLSEMIKMAFIDKAMPFKKLVILRVLGLRCYFKK